MNNKLHLNKKQSGFTMLEALIALFVLTIGILGVGGMQMQAMRAGHVAMQRVQAVTYTEELIERIRANKIGIDSYGGAEGLSGCNKGIVCTKETMAADDLSVWKSNVTRILPGTPEITIEVAPVNNVALDPENDGRIVNIEIKWNDRGDAYAFNSSTLINMR